MICFMRLVGILKSYSLKRDVSQIQSYTNEGIESWCGSKEWVCILWGEENVKWEKKK